MIIVADTSPLLSLSIIDSLNLLPKMYKQFFICKTVWDEVEKYLMRESVFEHLHFLQQHVKAVSDKSLIPVFNELDRGEAESIALLRELRADALLIDDMIGRGYAETRTFNALVF